MAQQGGMGAKLKITAGALTIVANMLELEFPAQKAIVAEATPHNASSGYAVFVATGKRELSEFKCTVGWEDGDTTHAAMLSNLGGTASVVFTIEDAAGAEVITFSGFVTEIQRVSKQDDSYRAEITIQPTGAPSIV